MGALRRCPALVNLLAAGCPLLRSPRLSGSRLKELDLSANTLGDETLTAACAAASSLERLDVSHCRSLQSPTLGERGDTSARSSRDGLRGAFSELSCRGGDAPLADRHRLRRVSHGPHPWPRPAARAWRRLPSPPALASPALPSPPLLSPLPRLPRLPPLPHLPSPSLSSAPLPPQADRRGGERAVCTLTAPGYPPPLPLPLALPADDPRAAALRGTPQRLLGAAGLDA